MSLAAIMREQEDERLARQLSSQFHQPAYKHVQQPAVEYDDDEILRQVLAESLREAQAQQQQMQLSQLDTTAVQSQIDEDSRLAVELQGQENRLAPQPKALTALQQQVLKMTYPTSDEQDESTEEDEEDEEVVDEYGRQLDPRIHDDAQRREDAELSHVARRMPGKMRNKIASTNGNLTALHHLEYRTRNKGKDERPASMNTASKSKKLQSKLAFRPKSTENEEEYGRVIRELGGNHLEVLCMDKVVRQCIIPGRLQHTNVWFTIGSFVLVKLRSYQDSKAELVLKYSAEEEVLLKEEFGVEVNLQLTPSPAQNTESAPAPAASPVLPADSTTAPVVPSSCT